MKIDDFLKEEMNWTDRDLEYRPVIGYWKVAELLQKWGEKQLLLNSVVGRSEQLVICKKCGSSEMYQYTKTKDKCDNCGNIQDY